MSDLEAQTRNNQIRDQLHSLIQWEKDMKQMEAKRAAVPDDQVGSIFIFLWINFLLQTISFNSPVC